MGNACNTIATLLYQPLSQFPNCDQLRSIGRFRSSLQHSSMRPPHWNESTASDLLFETKTSAISYFKKRNIKREVQLT